MTKSANNDLLCKLHFPPLGIKLIENMIQNRKCKYINYFDSKGKTNFPQGTNYYFEWNQRSVTPIPNNVMSIDVYILKFVNSDKN